jgi:hypothetical protein
VIGGTSIFGGRGGCRHDRRRAVPAVLATLSRCSTCRSSHAPLLFGLLILAVTAAYLRIADDSDAECSPISAGAGASPVRQHGSRHRLDATMRPL